MCWAGLVAGVTCMLGCQAKGYGVLCEAQGLPAWHFKWQMLQTGPQAARAGNHHVAAPCQLANIAAVPPPSDLTAAAP